MTWKTEEPGWETGSASCVEILMENGSVVIGSLEIVEHWTGEEDIPVFTFKDSAGRDVDWFQVAKWRVV